ncbi:DMT family transporter [Amycolatopsis alba]|uniref:EamA/RhaT family transporter n=2 Tax=Amycolatopsis alba TaxID=76020 RepID=A0A229S0D0_AMYAL|nr:DMT family transporter [Amycolatopsis alba]OXM52054.1 EamA/RhaT family transporter [Amycolatopsis alba DSM 44262]
MSEVTTRTSNWLKFGAPTAFVLMWSSGTIAVLYGLQNSSVVTFLLLRATGAAAVSWAVWLVVRDPLPVHRRQWTRLITVALLLQVFYQGFFFLALGSGTPAGVVAVLVGFQPVLTAILARPGYNPTLYAGLALGFVGVVVTSAAGIDLSEVGSVLGVVFSLAALVGITAGTLVQGRTTGVGVWSSLALQSTISAIVYAVIALTTGQLRAQINHQLAAAVGWMVLVVSVGATALLYVMIGRGEATKVTSLFYCVPPVTALLDWAFFGRFLNAWEMTGVVLVSLAVALTQRSKESDESA